MSSILKALKKLDEDKQSKLSAEQEEHAPAPPGRPVLLVVLGALVLGLIAGGGVAAWLLQGERPVPEKIAASRKEPSPGGAPAVEVQSGSEDLASAAASSPTPPDSPGRPSPESEFEPVVQPPVDLPAGPLRDKEFVPVGAAPRETAAAGRAAGASSESTIREERVESLQIPQPGFQKTVTRPVPELPFVVGEIIYTEDSDANLAVVNDLPVMEGTEIDGVLVKTILADRVVFEVDGHLVEIEPLPVTE